MTLLKDHKEEYKKHLENSLQGELQRYFNLTIEERFYKRWQILDPKKKVYLNSGQETTVTNYLTMLKADLNDISNRIKLLKEIIQENA